MLLLRELRRDCRCLDSLRSLDMTVKTGLARHDPHDRSDYFSVRLMAKPPPRAMVIGRTVSEVTGSLSILYACGFSL